MDHARRRWRAEAIRCHSAAGKKSWAIVGILYQHSAAVRPDAPVGTHETAIWVTTDSPVLPRFRVPVRIETEGPPHSP